MRARRMGVCIKCGHREIGPMWHIYDCFRYGSFHNRATCEHLHYKCICGYDWTAVTDDSPLSVESPMEETQQ
jgi:hypothetical protein